MNGTTPQALSHEFNFPLAVFNFGGCNAALSLSDEVGWQDGVQLLVVVERERTKDGVSGGHVEGCVSNGR